MCGFKPGDELVFISDAQLWDGKHDQCSPETGRVYVCLSVDAGREICEACGSDVGVFISDGAELPLCPCLLRKVQRRNDSLSITSFLTITPGFEEPRRQAIPAKKREPA